MPFNLSMTRQPPASSGFLPPFSARSPQATLRRKQHWGGRNCSSLEHCRSERNFLSPSFSPSLKCHFISFSFWMPVWSGLIGPKGKKGAETLGDWDPLAIDFPLKIINKKSEIIALALPSLGIPWKMALQASLALFDRFVGFLGANYDSDSYWGFVHFDMADSFWSKEGNEWFFGFFGFLKRHIKACVVISRGCWVAAIWYSSAKAKLFLLPFHGTRQGIRNNAFSFR